MKRTPKHHGIALRPVARALRRMRAPLGTAIALVLPLHAIAGPSGEQVVSGDSTVTRPDGLTTQVTQYTDRTAINWQSFDIGAAEQVIFLQPSSSSVALNRVVSADASEIYGRLSANGQVFLVNPNGVYFARGARVDVQGIVATTLDIADVDFERGAFRFSRRADAPDGSVVNEGALVAADGGYVVLAGDSVSNGGIVAARLGRVALASGGGVTLDFAGDGLIGLRIDEASLSEAAGVGNAGELAADGGVVLLTANAANRLGATVINNDGLIRAASIDESGGRIFLRGAGGDVTLGGTLDASGSEGNAGGRVIVTTDGDVRMASGGRIAVDGATGGTARVIAGGRFDFMEGARISASGSAGSGGFVELSGHGDLRVRGDVDLGAGGTLLIDPTTLTILGGDTAAPGGTAVAATVGEEFIETQLGLGANVVLVADTLINATGTFDDGQLGDATSTGDLTLRIGTVATGASTSFDDLATPGDCLNLGACAGGQFPTGRFAINSSLVGDINLGNIGIRTSGFLSLSAGTVTGNVTAGDLNASGVNVLAGGTAGNIALGNVTAATGGVLIGGFGIGSERTSGNTVVGNVSAAFGAQVFAGMSGTSTLTVGSVTVGSGDIAVGSLQNSDGVIFAGAGSANTGTLTNNSISVGRTTVGGGQVAVSGDIVAGFGSVDMLLTTGSGSVSGQVRANLLEVNASTTSDVSLTTRINLLDVIGGRSISIDNRASVGPLGLVDLNITTVSANSLSIQTGGDFSLQAPRTINVQGLHLSSAGNLDLSNASIAVGTGGTAFAGDPALILQMAGSGLTPPTSVRPNAAFIGSSVTLGNFSMTGDHLWLQADTLTLPPTMGTPANVFVQMLPFTSTNTIAVETVTGSPVTGTTYFTQNDHFAAFPGTTIALGGTSHQGPVVVGGAGSVNVGSKDMAFSTATGQSVTFLNPLVTTGVTAVIIGSGASGFGEILSRVSETTFGLFAEGGLDLQDDIEEARRRRAGGGGDDDLEDDPLLDLKDGGLAGRNLKCKG